jgi:hypothetical protein
MTFHSGPIDYHPGLNDPWLLAAYGLVAVFAACVTAVTRRSRPWLIGVGLLMVLIAPFFVGAVVHGLYFLVDQEAERILCTHYVRRSILPECSAVAGIVAGLLVRPRHNRHETKYG